MNHYDQIEPPTHDDAALSLTRENESAPPWHTSARTRLGRIVADETALYAVTVESLSDAGARSFGRLHALLAKQLPELGARLVRLEQCNGNTPVRRGSFAKESAGGPDAMRDEDEIIRLLFARHKNLLLRLREATTARADHFRDLTTASLLADLIASHEEDAFTLRALRWELSHAQPVPDQAPDEPEPVIEPDRRRLRPLTLHSVE